MNEPSPSEEPLDLPNSVLLRTIRRALERIIGPELQSKRAKTELAYVDTALRHLISREERRDDLLLQRMERDERVLSAPAPTPADLPAPDRSRVLRRRSDLVAQQIEHELQRAATQSIRAAQRFAAISDSTCLRAIESEKAHTDAQTTFEAQLSHVAHRDEDPAMAVTPERVTEYLQHLPQYKSVRVSSIEKVLGGFSKDIYLLDLMSSDPSKGMVIRRDNPDGAVHSQVADEFALLQHLLTVGIPVPTPLLLETNPAVFGGAFMLMEKMPGSAVPATVEVAVGLEQRDAARGLAHVLAKLHSLDVATLPLSQFQEQARSPPAQHFIDYINMWEAIWRADRVEASPTVSFAFEWLRRNAPAPAGPLRLIHGDAGLHNLLMDGSEVSAMLDWEFAHLGEPLEDLVYCRRWIDQILPWGEFLEHYYRAGGSPQSEENAQYYQVFDCVRGVVTCSTAAHSFWTAHCPQLNSFYAGLKYYRDFLSRLTLLVTNLR
ncbi:MAG: phosphotransferase family protein [Steroidobacteraceae bacterium]